MIYEYICKMAEGAYNIEGHALTTHELHMVQEVHDQLVDEMTRPQDMYKITLGAVNTAFGRLPVVINPKCPPGTVYLLNRKYTHFEPKEDA